MANSAAVPRLHQSVLRTHSACVSLPTLPVIPHPMSRIGDRSLLKSSGTASSLDLRRAKTVMAAGYPSASVATCVSWSQGDPLNNALLRKRRYRKRAMATKSKSEEEILDMVTERLVEGFEGIRNLFRSNEPVGQECCTPEGLLKIMYSTIGYINRDRFDRLLRNLGLDNKETISFDTFVSRFKEFRDIQYQWTPPLKREAEAARLKKAHPEEHLRNCEVYAWAQLKTASEAVYLLKKALKEKKVDLRSLMPEECYAPNGVVTKIQMRVALQQIGANLTDEEYRKFWEAYDKKLVGSLPLQQIYTHLDLDRDGNPLPPSSVRPPSPQPPPVVKPPTHKAVAPPRNPAKAAREFALGRHQIRGDPWHLEDGIRGETIHSRGSSGRGDSPGEESAAAAAQAEGEGEKPESPATEAAARGKIREVMNQKHQTRFEEIRDCLHHKFEERFISMNMAFKLFDIHQDGSVMRIDFRRVLREYGFPVTALKLCPLISRFGMSIKHGLINYRQLLNKLMNRTDAFSSTVLDDYISDVEEGRQKDSLSTSPEADVEEVATKLVQFLHQDYVKMASELLRKDRQHTGVLPHQDLRAAVDKCLGQAVSDAQWELLMTRLPLDEAGNVRYGDFMMSFDQGEPGSWNLQRHGTVTVPKNRVVNSPTEEVKRLERSKTDVYPVAEKAKEQRPLEQLRKELKLFFTDKLHDVDYRFKELDRKSHKRFSMWQFGAILKLCGFPMTEKELNDVWLSIKLSADNMSTFNAVVMEFAPNFTPFHGHDADKDEDEKGEEGRGVQEVERGKEEGPERAEAEAEGALQAEARVTTPRHILIGILCKAKPAIKKNWEKLRQSFRNQDPHGFGTVSFQSLQRTLDGLKCGLTKEERDQLCAQFDFSSNGRCNYLAFMKMFSEQPPKEPRLVYAAHRHRLQKKPSDAPKPITVSEAMHRIRDKLIHHWKNLRRAFQKHDRSRSGMMAVADFKRVLAECQVPVSENDLFHILSEFDANLNGTLSYQEFLDTLLRMDALTLND